MVPSVSKSRCTVKQHKAQGSSPGRFPITIFFVFMSQVQVLIAEKLLNEEQSHALKIILTQSFLKLHYWMHGDINLGTPDFAPRQGTLDQYLRTIEMLDLIDPQYFPKCFKVNPAPFTLANGIATSNVTLEVIVGRYKKNRAAADAAHQETYHR